MNGIRTGYAEQRDGRVDRNEWEGILGRLDVLVDEISRALGWSAGIEEPRDRLISKK
ncbi:hypothetical protein [Syntrophorhabdus aromaticivorans]|uniref:Uncharacterized protein n=1 Tax=Syntrophorhabdus aromaticivorans TaxID=328301 RepID=A0A971S199_9BACT|nr:hypothetical protein [Syntrophorhabdus aromaticivorans]NLW36290.1 hypothetical protein [Syntrophorhabdus aromaticivorans]